MPATSSYLQYLPAIFSQEFASQSSPFLGRFLLAFEQVLTGTAGFVQTPGNPESIPSYRQAGLETLLEKINLLFDPLTVRAIATLSAELSEPLSETAADQTKRIDQLEKEFLRWLAGWVALSLRADWTPEQQRQFIAQIVPLYQQRGTKENLVELLKIYAGEDSDPQVTEPDDTPLQIGIHSQVGVDTQIGGAIPHYFQVSVKLPRPDFELLKRQDDIVSALVDLQKPAHTYYDLTILYETMQIGVTSTIGENTLIGNLIPETR